MKDRIAAIGYNLHDLQWRVEELRGDLEKEADYNSVEFLEPIRKSVNNLAAVLIVADENLEEIEELISPESDGLSLPVHNSRQIPQKESIN